MCKETEKEIMEGLASDMLPYLEDALTRGVEEFAEKQGYVPFDGDNEFWETVRCNANEALIRDVESGKTYIVGWKVIAEVTPFTE